MTLIDMHSMLWHDIFLAVFLATCCCHHGAACAHREIPEDGMPSRLGAAKRLTDGAA